MGMKFEKEQWSKEIKILNQSFEKCTFESYHQVMLPILFSVVSDDSDFSVIKKKNVSVIKFTAVNNVI